MTTWYEQAEKRLKDGYDKVKGQKEGAMKSAVRDVLLEFCRQNAEFAQAVAQGGSFPDCMAAVAKGVGQLHHEHPAGAGGGRAAADRHPTGPLRFLLRGRVG